MRLGVAGGRGRLSSYRYGVQIPLRDLYDFDVNDLDDHSWDALEEKIAARYKNGPWVWTREVFQRGNIEKALKISVSPSYYEQTLMSFSREDRRIEEELLIGVGATDTFDLPAEKLPPRVVWAL